MTGPAALVTALLLQFASMPGFADPRIQVLPYDAARVVPVQVAEGYATLIELSSDERVENVVVGDSARWQVTANKQGDRVAVKPLAGATATNMMIVTDLRQYVFDLQPGGSAGQTPYVVRFTYASPPPLGQVAAAEPTMAGRYRLSGDRRLRPKAISDDGQRTSIVWDAKVPLPAVFAVDRHRKEALVNGRMVGDRYVIEGVASRYVFRLGRNTAEATRVRGSSTP